MVSCVAYAKGAPGHILALCTHAVTDGGTEPLDDRARTALLAANDELAADRTARAGGRVRPGVRAAEATLARADVRGIHRTRRSARAGVKDTIARLRRAGLRTVMLTGDQRLTAEAIGRELGVLGAAERVVDGRELDAMSSEELMATVRTCRVRSAASRPNTS